jgi:septum formation protein
MTTTLNPFPFNLILGSASPRRKALLHDLGYAFELRTQSGDETYPDNLMHHEITDYLAQKKANELRHTLSKNELLLTADTIVWHRKKVLEKPYNDDHAKETLLKLSGNWHEVITSVCFSTISTIKVVHDITKVRFRNLTPSMIDTYFKLGNPMDKAGAYGIQEWIGLAGVISIKGSYTNVVGLPTALVYETLENLSQQWEIKR